MLYYTTIDDVQEQLMKETPENVPDPTTEEYTNFINYLTNQLIPDTSKYINNVTHRFFIPLKETRNYYNRVLYKKDALDSYGYWLKWNASDFRLFVDLDLLEIITFTSTSTAITSTEYRITPPATFIDLDSDSNDFDFDRGSFNNAQIIAGWWGYHTDWVNAFTTVENVTIADANTTTITVTSTADDKYKRLQYLRCEDELMLITAIPSTTSLTVTRGVRGTTAAAHSAKPLQTFQIDSALHVAATRLVSWLYMNRVNQGNVVQITDNTVVLDTMPTMVKDNLNRLEKGIGA
jgi:hypothetical protein